MSNNKENLLQTALDLFAIQGYQAVSVRDICGKLGLKESALYYHFKNKKALLEVLYERVDLLIQEIKQQFGTAFASTSEVSDEAMCLVAIQMLHQYLCNPYTYKLIAMLAIERMSDEEAQANYQRLVFDLPLMQIKQVFTQMMERGFVKQQDAQTLAEAYYAIIFMAFERYCMGNPIEADHMEKAERMIHQGIADLYINVKRDEVNEGL